jgi:hypothetical protein
MATGSAGPRGWRNLGEADSAVHVFVTRRAIHRGPPEADFEAERMDWIPLADAPALIAGGQVRDASTAAALLWLRAGLDA